MKPAVQVLLAILVVAALVYIMYSQSQNKPEEGNSANDQVENAEVAMDIINVDGKSLDGGGKKTKKRKRKTNKRKYKGRKRSSRNYKSKNKKYTKRRR